MLKLLTGLLPNWIFKLFSRVLDYRLEMAQTDAKREETRADLARSIAASGGQAATAQMETKAFWVPWLIAAVPASAWYGWGMLDSLADGSLPDVAALPPQLEALTAKIFDSLFYSGAAMGVVQTLARSILPGRSK